MTDVLLTAAMWVLAAVILVMWETAVAACILPYSLGKLVTWSTATTAVAAILAALVVYLVGQA